MPRPRMGIWISRECDPLQFNLPAVSMWTCGREILFFRLWGILIRSCARSASAQPSALPPWRPFRQQGYHPTAKGREKPTRDSGYAGPDKNSDRVFRLNHFLCVGLDRFRDLRYNSRASQRCDNWIPYIKPFGEHTEIVFESKPIHIAFEQGSISLPAELCGSAFCVWIVNLLRLLAQGGRAKYAFLPLYKCDYTYFVSHQCMFQLLQKPMLDANNL